MAIWLKRAWESRNVASQNPKDIQMHETRNMPMDITFSYRWHPTLLNLHTLDLESPQCLKRSPPHGPIKQSIHLYGSAFICFIVPQFAINLHNYRWFSPSNWFEQLVLISLGRQMSNWYSLEPIKPIMLQILAICVTSKWTIEFQKAFQMLDRDKACTPRIRIPFDYFLSIFSPPIPIIKNINVTGGLNNNSWLSHSPASRGW